MRKFSTFIFLIAVLLSCKTEIENSKTKFLVDEIPNDIPIDFKQKIS